MLKKLISFCLVGCLVITSFAFLVGAASADNDSGRPALGKPSTLEFDSIEVQETLSMEALGINPKQRAMNQFTDELFYYSENVTAEDPTDFFFFSISNGRRMLFKIDSSDNPSCIMQLCLVDWTTGTVQPTQIYTIPGMDITKVTDVPSGDYAFYIYSGNSNQVTASYDISYNGKNHSGGSLLYTAPDVSTATVYSGGTLEANGVSVNLHPNINDKISYAWPVSGGVQHIDYKFTGVQPVHAYYGTFISSEVNSLNVIYFQLPVGTTFTATDSAVGSGGHLWFTFEDVRGLETPRQFDFEDAPPNVTDPQYSEWGPQFLVYDLHVNQFIAFPSKLNVRYLKGALTVDMQKSKSLQKLY